MSLDRALDLLLAHEGGFSDHPSDKGGKTLWGVTEGVFHQWLRSKGKAARDVRAMTKDECRELYRDLFWTKCGADKLPWPISYLAFDGGVNSGATRGAKWVQAGLGLTADGAVGPRTVAAAQKAVDACDARKIVAIVRARADFIAELIEKKPSQVVFLKGWMRRLMDVQARGIVDLVNEGG